MTSINNEQTIKKILSVLQECYVSDGDYNSSQQPCFMGNKSQKFTINFQLEKSGIEIPTKLNRNIKLIYKFFGNPKKEIYIGEWTIMGLEQAIENYKNFCNKGQENVFDIGYRYLGMGHIEVISCDLNSHLLFYRRDGGSNGWDRQYNFEKIIKEGSDNYQQFYFSEWFYNIDLDSNNE